VSNSGTFANSGSVTGNVDNTGTFIASGTSSIGGTLTNDGNATVVAGGSLTAGGILNNGSFVNNGTVNDDLDNTGVYTNNGVQNADVASNTGTINNAAGAVWNGNFNTAGVLNNGGTIDGTLTQSAGTATVTGTINGAVAINGGTLTGTGTVGATQINSGGILANTAGNNLTINGDLTLAAGAHVAVMLDAPSTAQLFTVNGVLSSDGAVVDIADAGNLGDGLYRIFDYTGGSLAAGSTFVVGDAPPVTVDTRLTVTRDAGYIDLLVKTGSGGAFRFWDGANMVSLDDGAWHGGSGVWSATNTNWANEQADENGIYDANALLVFAGAGGDVTVDAGGVSIGAGGVQFVADGYTVGGGAITLLAGNTPFAVNGGVSATVASELTGDGGLNKQGAGVLVLSAINSYSGLTTVNAGTLAVAATGGVMGDVVNKATFDNAGAVGGSVSNAAGATFTQSGTTDRDVTNAGTFNNAGNVIGTLTNTGTVNASGGTFYGAIANNAGGAFNVSGAVTGYSSFNNASDATLSVADGGSFFINVTGSLTNNGSVTVDAGGLLNARGGIRNNGSFTNNGTVTDDLFNTGLYTNNGVQNAVVASNTGTINNTAGAVWTGDFNTSGTVNNAGSIVGAFTQTAGTSTNNGSISGMVTVSGGRFAGNGSFGGLNVASGATLAPGDGAIGAMTVNGNLSFAAGSTYEVKANAAGQADRLLVTGTASLNGTVTVLAGAGEYAVDTNYTIVTAAGGRNGQFANATSNFAFLDALLTYDATHAYLTLSRNDISFAGIGGTGNQQATGKAVDSLGHGNGLWDAVVYMDESMARNAFDQLSGEIHASAKSALIEDNRFVREAALERLQAEGAGAWGRLSGSWGSMDGDGNAAGMHRSMAGLFVGADGQVSDAWRIGAVAGYGNSRFDNNASGSSNTWQVGGYAGGQWNNFVFNAGAAYAWHAISTDRTVNVPGISDRLKSSYNANTEQAFAEVGYKVEGKTISVEPFVNATWVKLNTDDFIEKGGAAALSGTSSSDNVTFTTLGIHFGKALAKERGQFNATLGWRTASGDITPMTRMQFAGSDSFGIQGTPIAKNAAVVSLGMDFVHTDKVNIGVSYNGQFGNGSTDNGLRADVRVKF
jgi:outer membrane autotransporter protein